MRLFNNRSLIKNRRTACFHYLTTCSSFTRRLESNRFRTSAEQENNQTNRSCRVMFPGKEKTSRGAQQDANEPTSIRAACLFGERREDKTAPRHRLRDIKNIIRPSKNAGWGREGGYIFLYTETHVVRGHQGAWVQREEAAEQREKVSLGEEAGNSSLILKMNEKQQQHQQQQQFYHVPNAHVHFHRESVRAAATLNVEERGRAKGSERSDDCFHSCPQSGEASTSGEVRHKDDKRRPEG